ncbi:transcriptional regulator, TetR family [Kushneria avicenniae]|uniref:Transcriptional regulator, TetR family n=1 Tax=Kushneria avicenniae TaxID=402385 RepID=A0A1I1KYH0_9GAMM|nr:TetR/AcrR family transcriptional regulator [Kushneria avicenniae]SFC65849.1 transcriptional regulator, TetR family [Kushneria avicenniae]
MSTETRIREVGLRLFAEQGYEATPLSAIAREVGIRTPSLYNHFVSKEALFLGLVEEVEAEMLEVVEHSLTGGAGVEQRLQNLLQACSDFIFDSGRGVFYKRFLLFPPPSLSQPLRQISRDSETAIDALLESAFQEGIAQGVLRNDLEKNDFISMTYCVIDGLFSESFLYDRVTFNQRLASIRRVYWAGIVAR